MFEVNAWFVIYANTDADQLDDAKLEEALTELREMLATFTWSGFADLCVDNGQWVLTVRSNPNRPRHEAKQLDDLLTFLATRTPGSYGLVYDRDDERDAWPGDNAFRVRVLARGAVTERDDPFLSPWQPVIED